MTASCRELEDLKTTLHRYRKHDAPFQVYVVLLYPWLRPSARIYLWEAERWQGDIERPDDKYRYVPTELGRANSVFLLVELIETTSHSS